MASLTLFGTRFIAGDISPLPKPDNNNWRLMEPWMTPAEFLQWVHREKEREQRQVAADPRLLACPKHRLTREITLAMEKCCLWHYYGVREA
jgi:hypothetical protein